MVGVVADGAEVVDAVTEHKPDVILLDLSLPGRNGLDLIPDILRVSPDTRIVMVTMHADQPIARAAIAAGARGFVPKDVPVEELLSAIRRVLAGKEYLSPHVAHTFGPPPATTDLEGFWRLTPRQLAIMRGIARGLSSAEIAQQLQVSIHTIHFHRRNIRRILGIQSEDGLARAAMLLPPEEPPDDESSDQEASSDQNE